MRHIVDVIESLLTVTPESEKVLRQTLEHHANDCKYTAPEGMARRWDMLSSIVNIGISYPPKEDWQKKFVEIFIDKEFKC